MIQVIYFRDHHRLTASGHAYSSEPGHDPVCAGVSALVYTLAENVLRMQDIGYLRKNPVLRLESGDAEIRVVPRARFSSVVTLVFDAICAGFSLIAAGHPENISFEIRGQG